MSAVHPLIPGGAHTYAKGDDQYPADMAPVIERGAGCRVWDLDGNEYVEFGSGLRSTTLGHGFEPVVTAVQSQLARGISFVRPHRIELEAAERLVDLIPSAEMVKFGINGSDATTAAVRLARAFTGRDMVAVCGYHGWQDWYIGSTARNKGVREGTRSMTHGFDYNNLESLERLFGEHPREFAAVIMEPMNVAEP